MSVKSEIDARWSEYVQKDAQENDKKDHHPSFRVFFTSLAMQAMIALGKLENPFTQKLEKNLSQARHLIDTIIIIQEKTSNNLNDEEDKLVKESVENLKRIFLSEIEEKGKDNE